MEPDEKTAAVKKAYAEMILNTAKEAAARVMAAERRAVRYEHDLRDTKDNAVNMLTRLKRMIDCATSEAETTSLNKERKIEELEAQLYEAEDIITDLRSELNQAWGELERVDPSEVESLNGRTTMEDASFSGNVTPEPMSLHPGLGPENPSFSGNMTPEPMTLSPGLSPESAPSSGLENIPMTRDLDHKINNGFEETEQVSHLRVSDVEKSRAPFHDIDSIIMRSKESDNLRNGCTQRIRALERNSFDGKLPLSGNEGDHGSNKLSELVVKASDNDIVVKKPSFGESNTPFEVVPLGTSDKTPVEVRTVQRKKSQSGKGKTSFPSCPSPLMTSFQPSSVKSNDGTCKGASIPPPIDACIPSSVKDITRMSGGLHSRRYPIDGKFIQMGKTESNMQSQDGSSTSVASTGQPSHVLSRCRTVAYLINGDVKSCEDRPNTAEKVEAKMKPLPRLDPGRTLLRRNVDPISGSTSVKFSIKGISKSGPGQTGADRDSEATNVPVSINPGKDVVEISEASSSKHSIGTGVKSGTSSSLVDVEVLKQSSESPSHRGDSGILKNTSQRKRMSSSSNPVETASFEENMNKRRAEERVSILPQPHNDSSRESRRLTQVAQQLISLSGKRWYK